MATRTLGSKAAADVKADSRFQRISGGTSEIVKQAATLFDEEIAGIVTAK